MTVREPKMDPEWRARWVEALRSGEYDQGKGALREGDSYCCLGVLCDISGVGAWHSHGRGVGFDFVSGRDTAHALLHKAVCLEVGMPQDLRTRRFVNSRLTNLNDSGTSFEDIASLIEERL